MGQDLTIAGPASTYDFSGNDPSTETVVHANSGQSLAEIAETLHVDPNALAKANPLIHDPRQALSPFQEIRVPQDLKPQWPEAPVPYEDPRSADQTSKSSLPPQPPGVSAEASAMKATLKAKAQPGGTPVAGTKPPLGATVAAGGAGGAGVVAAGAVYAAPLSADEALDLAEHGDIGLVVRSHEGHQKIWELNGGQGEAPAVMNRDGRWPVRSRTIEIGRDGSSSVTADSGKQTVEIDFDKLSPEEQKRALDLVRAEDVAKGGNVDERPGIAEDQGAAEEGAEAAEKGVTKKGMGVGDTVVDRAGKGAEAAEKGASELGKGARITEKGMGVAEEGASAAGRAAVEAGEEGAAKVAGAGVAAGEILGFVGFMLEPFEMMGSYFGTFEEVKNAVKSRGYTDGFSEGIAAAMKGVPQDQVREKFGREVATDSIGTKVGGAEGVEDRYHNKGLVDGYKYFQSLPPEKQQKLRDAAQANGWDLNKDDVTQLERGVRPMVVDMFEKAAEAAKEAAERKAAEEAASHSEWEGDSF